MNSRPRVPYISQFFILLGLVIFFLLFFGTLLLVIASQILHVKIVDVPNALLKPENVNFSRWFQFITTFLSFLLPAYIFSLIVSNHPFRYNGFNSNVSLKQVGYVILIMIGALILSNSLSYLGHQIPFSSYFKNLANDLEKQYLEQVKALALMKDFKDYLTSLIIIAVLPAIFEEVLFRGCFQNVFVGWFRNAFWGILITSLLFSAIHASIYEFITRTVLSIILGYLFYYSRNLWLNIFFHFLNNGTAITMAYLYSKQGKPIEQSLETIMPYWYGIIALIGLIFLFKGFRKESINLNPIDTNDYLKKERDPFKNHPSAVL